MVIPDEAIVVRGGAEWRHDRLMAAAEAHHRDTGEYALTVWSLPDMTAEEIVVAVGAVGFPHGKVRVSTAGRLRAAGFEVVASEPKPSEPPGHVDVKSGGPLDDSLAAAFIDAFDPAIPNPLRVAHG